MLSRIYIKITLYINDLDAATAIEYGLIAAGIAVAISGAIFAFGSAIGLNFENSDALVSQRP